MVQEALPLPLQASSPNLFLVLQVYTQICQFTSFWEHEIGYLTKRIESFNDCIEHDNKMLVSIKVLYITFSFLFTTEFEIN